MDPFQALRSLVLAEVHTFAADADVLPIEQTLDGWFALTRAGDVVHVDAGGSVAASDVAPALALALVGKLSRRFPLASLFLPSVREADVCPACHGEGYVATLPEQLRESVICRCGGIGWVPGRGA